MLINYVRGEECRIAVVDNGKLEELFCERESSESHVGNVYKGRIMNVEPSIQAAFIDFGFEKNGFLHISDVHPQYFTRQHHPENVKERVGQKTPRRERPPIQHCLRRGQEVIVQMTKEGIGSKGPTLTTYVSIPGRYLVMMPGMSRIGISRKIEDEETRGKIRQVVAELDLPKDIGFIIRTAGIDRNKRELQRDLNYLKRLWKVVQHRINTGKAPVEVYQESDLVTRTIRDVFDTEIDKIIIDDAEIVGRAKDFLSIVMPRYQERVEYYDGKIPLFYKYGIEDQIAQINSRRVELASGGFMVIDQAEALVAIDVNSGKFRQPENAEQTALEINLEAADEIIRQLKLRDLGGVIVIDFIDMRMESHHREVERKIRDGLKDDRAKTKVLKMSQFGIIELTRQRMRASREKSLHTDCPCCKGIGRVKTSESISLDVMRLVQLALYQKNVNLLEVTVSAEVFEYLHNRRNRELLQLEEDTKKKVRLHVGKDLSTDAVEVKCFDVHNHEIPLEHVTKVQAPKEPEPRAPEAPKPPPPHSQDDRRDRDRDHGRDRGRGRGRRSHRNRNRDYDHNQVREPEEKPQEPEIQDRREELEENDTLLIEDSTPLDEE